MYLLRSSSWAHRAPVEARGQIHAAEAPAEAAVAAAAPAAALAAAASVSIFV